MGSSRKLLALALAVAVHVPVSARGAPSSYSVGTIPVAVGQGDLEFPIAGDFRGQGGVILLSQGTFDDRNPFAYLSGVSPWAWLHYDGIPNLRLSAAFQEVWSLGVSAMNIPSSHEERFILRGRVQQPRGTSALYQMLQLDLRSFDDAAGEHHFVFRPRLRLGVGFNLDATRIHSMSLFQEAALRFSDSSYTTRAFEFYRAVVGYTWTTKRGLFVTAAVVGQVVMNPQGTGLAFQYGPVLTLAYRIAPAAARAAEPAPEPVDVEPP